MSKTANLQNSLGDSLHIPEAYQVTSIVLENHMGMTYDLNTLKTDFSITESIYHAGLILSINIKDSINFFEIGQLTGQETITVNLTQGAEPEPDAETASTKSADSVSREKPKPKTISRMFFVTEYPLYGKMENRIEVYTIKGVSRHMYLSKLKRISKAFSGTMAAFIKETLTRDLGVKESDILLSKQSSPLVSFIVPNLNPIDAILWVLRRCYDSHGSPWYCYETLDGKIHIESHTDMNAKARENNIQEYTDGQFFQYTVGTSKDFKQRKSRILNLASNIGISKYLSSINGAYASKSVYVNISSKKIETVDFNYGVEFPKMAKIGTNSPLSHAFFPEARRVVDKASKTDVTTDKFNFRKNPKNPFDKADITNTIRAFESISSQINAGGLTLSQFSDANINYISLNGKSLGNNNNYHSSTRNKSINVANSVNENMQFISHDFTITGDLDFHSGKIVKLQLRSTFKPTNELDKKDENKNQEMFSGHYLITSVIHKFEKQYYCDVRANTDAYSSEVFK